LAGLGLIVPRLARQMAKKRSPAFNLGLLAAVTLVGLLGMSRFWPIVGLFPFMVLLAVMHCIHFLVSDALNRVTDSQQRATVLSFKGLSYNLAYGLIGLLYSLLLLGLKAGVPVGGMPLSEGSSNDAVFVQSLAWFPGYFTLLLACLLLYARRHLKDGDWARRGG
jgi:hypothetical protein